MRGKLLLLPLALLLIAAAPPDPAQEARAQVLFHELRCVVCQGESVAESTAEVAVDIRRTVRERIAAGQGDAAIKRELVAAYGEKILMRPPFSRETYVLWFAPVAILMLGGAILFAYLGAARMERK